MNRHHLLLSLALLVGGLSYQPLSAQITDVVTSRQADYTEYATNGNLIGRGRDQALFALHSSQFALLRRLTLDLAGTTHLSDISRLKVYQTSRTDRFDPRSPGKPIGQTRLDGLPLASIPIEPRNSTTDTVLWVVADISKFATEGNRVRTRLLSMESVLGKISLDGTQAEHEQEIVLERTLIWSPGDDGSNHYRIPAIIRLKNGTLIASADKRKNTDVDLPADIDVVIKRSTDGGKTWSAPITVAQGRPDFGYGDAAMVTDGKVIHMVMAGGAGFWQYPAAAKEPLQMFYTQSRDGGKTWQPLRNISREIYGERWPWGGFNTSGNGIITSKGRIIFVAAMRADKNWGGQSDNIFVYSDDQGQSWHASPVVRDHGDESKVAELNDGTLLLSSRNRASGANARTLVHLTADGRQLSAPRQEPVLTGNACNGALTRYRPLGSKQHSRVLLQTLPASATRDHLKLFISEDEGKSWREALTLCRGESVYSEIVALPDGTIGVISEENDKPAFDIYYTRLSLKRFLEKQK